MKAIEQSTQLKEALKSHNPLVSIIIPCFNKAGYLAESVESALAQTYPAIEIVIVDDGSSDNSVEIARGFLKNDSGRSVRLVQRKNGGISAARNTGIDEARGTIVTCLDADDLMHPTLISLAVERMRRTGANLVCSDVEMFGEKNGRWRPEAYEPFAVKYNNSIPTLAVFDKAMWSAVGGYNTSFAFNEDWDFYVRCSAYGLHVSRLEDPLFKYRVTNDGLASTFIEDTWMFSVALIMTANDSLYPVEQVLYAQSQLNKMPDKWVARLKKQLELYPSSPLLNLWLGLAAEGKNLTEEAAFRFEIASKLCHERWWQPLLKLGNLVGQNNLAVQKQFLHVARTERPDLTRYVIQILAPADSEDLKKYQMLCQL